MPFKIKERFCGNFNTSSVLWLHGASLGECQVLLFLAKRLTREIKNCPPLLLTSQKAEVVDFLKTKLEGVSKIQVHIAPAPFYFIVKHFYRQVKPLALILCENELWPAYLALEQERKSDARLALISGRFKRGNFLPKKILPPKIFAFADFQTNEDKERFLKKCNLPFATVNGNWKLLGKKTFLENHDKKIDASFLSLHFKELPFLKDLFKNLSKEKLLIVADGMGGHKDGEVASSIALNLICDRFKNISSVGNKEDAINWIQTTVSEANVEIFKYVTDHPESQGMGTTIVLAILTPSFLLIGNIGDSSGYVLKNGTLHKVTKDHTLVNLLVETGELTKEEALNHPRKNVLMRALGANNPVDVDIFDVDMDSDAVLLCSDGLTNMLTKAQIQKVLNSELTLEEKIVKLFLEKYSIPQVPYTIYNNNINI